MVISIEPSSRYQETDLIDFPGVSEVISICPKLHAYKVVKSDGISIEALAEQLDNHFAVNSVQYDYFTESRFSPNDEFFSSQWALAKIQAPETWDITTGGTNYDGHEIVIAILDDGYQVTHEDLEANIWSNPFEIENNGIDDDMNGYIDDKIGWNFDNNSDAHDADTHGTSVAGIIGASGDNLTGISGINLNVKMMVLSGVNQLSEIIEAYNYVLAQRTRFNNSNGTQGSFVVATNFSAGIPEAFGSNFPIWCGLYNEMGLEGILSSTAVDNDSYNVDLLGDMPTTCQSQFLITVTNTDEVDEFDGAFGTQNVDIGAPGSSILTTNKGDEYDNFPGTSAAAPHVGGAVALLHSVKCPLLSSIAIEDPSASAVAIKDAIMNGSDEIIALKDRTVTEGRLNLFESLKLVQLYCGGSLGTLELRQGGFDNEKTYFNYETPNFEPYDLQVFDAFGRLILDQEILPPSFGDKRLEIVTKDWPSGIYFIRLSSDETDVVRKFFVE